jgi:hypothetical protein
METTEINQSRNKRVETVLNWQVGSQIRADVLGDMRAAFGEQILPTLSAKLAPEYGQWFGESSIDDRHVDLERRHPLINAPIALLRWGFGITGYQFPCHGAMIR